MKRQLAEVFCQHNSDGSIIPIKFIIELDGKRQAYNILQFRDISHTGTRTLPNGLYVNNNDYAFVCEISFMEQIQRKNLLC